MFLRVFQYANVCSILYWSILNLFWHHFCQFGIFLCLWLFFRLFFGLDTFLGTLAGFLNTLKLLFWWLYGILFYIWICILIANNLLFLQILCFTLCHFTTILLTWAVSFLLCRDFFIFLGFFPIFQIFIFNFLIIYFFA